MYESYYCQLIMDLITLLNNNQGFVAAVGLCLFIPLAIFSDKIIRLFLKREYKKALREWLVKELWINMNFVSHLEVSYENNLKDDKNVHIPHYGPRISVIEKFFEFDILSSLKANERESVIEIYDQLKNLRHEYYLWRELLVKSEIKRDKVLYKTISSTMISYVNPVMQNMLNLWIVLVRDFGTKSNIPQIQKLNNILLTKIREGKWIRPSYKASFFNKDEYKNIDKFDVILCWDNDWKETEKEVIEIKPLSYWAQHHND